MPDAEIPATTSSPSAGAGSLAWLARIANYRQHFSAAYLGDGEGPHLENNWVTGVWFMGNSYQKRDAYYGAFQGNFLRRIATLFPDRKRALHVFAGKVDLTAFPGDTLDSNPALNPTYCCNAENCDGVPLHLYDFVLADPPYSESDAERYGRCMVNRNRVMQSLSAGLPSGAFIVWLDQVLPMYRKAELKIEAVIGIVGSTNHRFRVLTVFRRL
jgi:hypothetical protein